jgi:phenylacetate-coenzyme A ligase PaaK-like adenylate-forming protein
VDRLHGIAKAGYTVAFFAVARALISSRLRWLRRYRALGAAERALERYRLFVRLYESSGLSRGDVAGLADLRRLPLVSKAMLKVAPLRDLRPARWRVPVMMKMTTSGSSGTPFAFYRSLDLLVLNAAHLPVAEIVNALRRQRPDCVVAHPDMVEDVVNFMMRQGGVHRDPIVLALGAEVLTDRLRKQIRTVFPNSRVVDLYNAVETGMMAYECPHGGGKHVNDYAVVLEEGERVVDADGGEYFAPVLTNLWNYGTPLIRYTGIEDLLQTATAGCGCGCGGTAITRIIGRQAEFIHRPDGRSVSVTIVASAHADPRPSPGTPRRGCAGTRGPRSASRARRSSASSEMPPRSSCRCWFGSEQAPSPRANRGGKRVESLPCLPTPRSSFPWCASGAPTPPTGRSCARSRWASTTGPRSACWA